MAELLSARIHRVVRVALLTATISQRPLKAGKLIAHDRAAFVAYPIAEAQIVDPHVVKSGANRRRGA